MTPKKRFITCEICGYRSSRTNSVKRIFMAKFPLDVFRCRLWVKAVGKEDLVYVPIEKLHSLKYVCGNHFNQSDFNKKKNRLKKNAIPSLNLKAEPLPDDMLLEFPCHMHSDNYSVAHRRDHEYSLNSTQSQHESKQLDTHILKTNISAADNQRDTVSNVATFPPTTLALGSYDDSALGSNDDGVLSSNEDGELGMIDDDEIISDTENDVVIPAQSRDIKNEQHYDPKVHEGYSCNMCAGPIIGFRYHCIQCSDWDMCGTCEAKYSHSAHYVLRVPAPKPFAEVQAVVEQIRRALEMIANDPLYSGTFQPTDSVPLDTDEIKSEDLTEEGDNLNLTSGNENFISCDRVSAENLVPTINDFNTLLKANTKSHHDKIENPDDIEFLDDIEYLDDSTEYAVDSTPAIADLVPTTYDAPIVLGRIQDIYMDVTDDDPDRDRKKQQSCLTRILNSNKIRRKYTNNSVIGDNAKRKGPSLPNVENFQPRVVLRRLNIPKIAFGIKPTKVNLVNK